MTRAGGAGGMSRKTKGRKGWMAQRGDNEEARRRHEGRRVSRTWVRRARARTGSLLKTRIPARGMRVRRKRGEQLLSCQRRPLNLPADLFTIGTRSRRRRPSRVLPRPTDSAFLSCVSSFVVVFAASFCYLAPVRVLCLSPISLGFF